MNYRRHHAPPLEVPPILETKDELIEIIKEVLPEAEIIVIPPTPIIEEIKPPINPVITKQTNKRVPKKKPAKKTVPKVIADELRGLELNAKTGGIDSNVHTARLFKSIVKMKGLKINKVLHGILTKWIKENS